MKFQFPDGMRPASVDERASYYREEFSMDVFDRLRERWPQPIPIVDVGSESTLYRPRFKQYKGKLVRLRNYRDLGHLHEKLIEYAPEDLYYRTVIEREDRIETNPRQELVFDLDPEELDCRRCDRQREYLEGDAKDYLFCTECFSDLAGRARELFSFLERHFDEMMLVYSGRGFHIHVQDEEAFRMDREDRRELASRVAAEFPVDRKVTAGDIELVRLPGSLHGLVSRKVMELDVEELAEPEAIIETKAVPDFLDLE